WRGARNRGGRSGGSAGHAVRGQYRAPFTRLVRTRMTAARLSARTASPSDAEAIAVIYNEGIADRVGTFETEPRSAQQIEAWFDGRHPIGVGEAGREVVAFASTSAYRSRPCYAG